MLSSPAVLSAHPPPPGSPHSCPSAWPHSPHSFGNWPLVAFLLDRQDPGEAELCLPGLSTGPGWHIGKLDHFTKFSERPEPSACVGCWGRSSERKGQGLPPQTARLHVSTCACVCVHVCTGWTSVHQGNHLRSTLLPQGAALPSGGPTALCRASPRGPGHLCLPSAPRESPPAGTDRDDGWTAVLQVQEQGHHALVYLGPQATQLPARHGCHQVPEQCHGRRPDPIPLLQGRAQSHS